MFNIVVCSLNWPPFRARCRQLRASHSLTSRLKGVTMYVLYDYASIPNIFYTHNK